MLHQYQHVTTSSLLLWLFIRWLVYISVVAVFWFRKLGKHTASVAFHNFYVHFNFTSVQLVLYKFVYF